MPSPIVLILAAGQGVRYRAAGGPTHKLQALLAGRPVLQRTVESVQAAGLPLHLEQGPHPGMGDCLAAAVAATADAGGWLILPADMPLVLPQTLQAVAAALVAGSSAAQPVVQGRRGHPVGFGPMHADALRALQGDEGARSLLVALRRQGLVAEIGSDDLGTLHDIDTPEDLQRAEALRTQRLSA